MRSAKFLEWVRVCGSCKAEVLGSLVGMIPYIGMIPVWYSTVALIFSCEHGYYGGPPKP